MAAEREQLLQARDVLTRVEAFDRGELTSYPAEDVVADAKLISHVLSIDTTQS